MEKTKSKKDRSLSRKNKPSWELMPEVSDFSNPARMMRNIEGEIRDHTEYGVLPFPEDYGFEDSYYDDEGY